MIKKLFITALCLAGLIYRPAFSQKINGIFLTCDDYVSGKLSYVSAPMHHVKINLNELFNKPYITIKLNDTIIKLCKDSVFGLLDCTNTIYRLYLKDRFTLINTGEHVLIYSQTTFVQNKSFPETNYFFSVSANSAILPLTIWNLKKAFPGDDSFHDLIDAYFKYDSELINYDYFHKEFKINYLFDLTHR